MKELLEALVEACPERFGKFEEGELVVYDDLCDDWIFQEDKVDATWLMDELNELPIAAIYKLEGKSWEESILNAIMHWHQTNKEGK